MTTQHLSLAGKTCMVTGPTSGIGFETAAALAALGAHVVLACRDVNRGEESRRAIAARAVPGTCEVMHLDLASRASIRSFANAFMQSGSPLDVLVNNAAIILMRRETTQDGIEKQFGVNHLGPFLLTLLLLDRIKATPHARIVNVASTVHHNATLDFGDLQSEKSYSAMQAYSRSKLGNVMFTYALARRLNGTGVTANCLHPGVVRSHITRDIPAFLQPLVRASGAFMLSPARGAQTSVYLASSPDVDGVTGKYFVKCREVPSSAASQDINAQERLWQISAELTGLTA